MTISCLGKSAMHFLVTRQLSPLVQSTQPPKNNSTQPIPKSNMSSLHFELPTSSLFLHLMILCRPARARITRSWAHITSHPLLHEHGKAHITSHIVLSENRESSHHITSSCCAWKWESPFVPRAWVPGPHQSQRALDGVHHHAQWTGQTEKWWLKLFTSKNL